MHASECKGFERLSKYLQRHYCFRYDLYEREAPSFVDKEKVLMKIPVRSDVCSCA